MSEQSLDIVMGSSTVIVCNSCKNTSFEIKSDEKDMFLSCRSCGTDVTLKKGGVIDAPRFTLDDDAFELVRFAIMPVKTPNSKPVTKTDKPMVAINMSVPQSTRELVRAGLEIARAEMGIEGRSFGGTALGYVFADYIAGANIANFSHEAQSKIYNHLNMAQKIADEQEANSVLTDDQRESSLRQVEVAEKAKGFEKYKNDNKPEVRVNNEQTELEVNDKEGQDEE